MTANIKNTIAEQLQAAKDSLTEDNWRKGRYFRYENNMVCMCVHGAIQAQCNQRVIDSLPADGGAVAEAEAAYVASKSMAGVARAGAGAMAEELGNNKSVWDSRPSWIGSNNAPNYVAGMVGLTTGFNDAPDTTLDMVKSKLDEAINVAKGLGI